MKYPIPEAALHQNIAVLGKNGSGKTYAAKAVIVEPLLADGRRVGIVDPTGAWWGLRTSRDGKGGGFKILVLGGDHGDLPLPPNGGAAVARLIAVQGVNLVADTSQMTVGERTRWFTEFAGTLYRANKSPLHLILDEAHNFAPQGKVPDPDAGKMLHAASTLASQGRSRGIRLTMITQRPQKLHKDSLTSAETLIAMRVIHPLDRGAVADWINGCADQVKGKEVLDSLAGLKTGEGWTWHPGESFLLRMKFPAIKTFDSSATPMDGESAADQKGAAEIDLTEIKAALADAVKEAEANDPKLLRAEIARLKRGLEKKPDPGPTQAWRAEYEEAHARDIERASEHGRQLVIDEIRAPLHEAQLALERLNEELVQLTVEPMKPIRDFSKLKVKALIIKHPIQFANSRKSASSDSDIGSGGIRRMLIALAQHPQGLNKRQLGVRAVLSSSSGTFSTYLAKLRSQGWVNGNADTISITGAGLDALGSYESLPMGRDLLEYWKGELGGGAARLLEAIAETYPEAISREKAAKKANLAEGSGTFSTYLAKLRTLELVTGRGELCASGELFE